MCEILERKRMEGLQEGLQQGRQQGLQQGILNLLAILDEVPSSLQTHITKQEDTDILTAWLKHAAKSPSIQEFEAMIDENAQGIF